MKKSIMFICIICMFVSSFAHAADDAVIDLDAVVVTATRYEKLLKDVPQNVTVISEEEIEKSSAKTVTELINNVAGIQLQPYGSLGSQATVSMRGMNSSQVLVLVDGRPINKFQNGQATLSSMSSSNVASIEIIRGAASSLYGSNAMGGVINIITKKKTTNSIDVSYGTYNTFHTDMTMSKSDDDATYTFTASKDLSDGHREYSGYDSNNVNFYYGRKISDNWNIGLSTGYHTSNLEMPGSASYASYGEQYEQSYYTDVELSNSKGILFKAYTNSDTMNVVNYGTSSFENDSSGVEAKLSRRLNDWNYITIGTEYHDYQIDSDEVGEQSMYQISSYFQDEIDINSALITIGARYDYYRGMDAQLSPSAAVLIYLTDSTNLRLSAGESYRVPTFNDLYWPFTDWGDFGQYEGNLDLSAEKGTSYEISVDTQLSNKAWFRVSGFYNDIEDLITWGVGDDGVNRPYNVNNAEIKGVEVEGKAKFLEYFTANIGYTYLDAKDKDTNENLVYRPDNKVDAKLEANFDSTTLELILQYVGERDYLDYYSGEREILEDYTTVSAKLSHAIDDDTTVYIKGDNIFDEEYSFQKDYPMPGATYYVGVNVKY